MLPVLAYFCELYLFVTKQKLHKHYLQLTSLNKTNKKVNNITKIILIKPSTTETIICVAFSMYCELCSALI